MVPNRGRDLAPLIVEFGARLLKYEIICHIHSKRSSHNEKLSGWFEHIFERLFGAVNSGDASILQILQLFERDAKFIYPEDNLYFSVEYSNGWGKNWKIAKKILDSYSKYTIENYPNINFPQGSMFWAKSECIKDFLLLPISYEDFPKEPISDDGTLAHALERLIMIFSENYPGKFYRIHIGDSIHNYCDYENQIEFTNKINDDSVKVLSYYLPQFHPIPENDKWHGNGFTEWTKVRSANPLFVGHYQQHIPHKDIGYYIINSPEILRKQFQIMKASGVFGQVFYHYWFKGKLILEKPAKMLLDNKDILMPFCFCWANENWTMRWDGNENEVLLKQEYSASDAEEFIQYLIPFFKDKRYIRIDNRPVLFIYRPTAIPDPKIYLNIWNKICGEFKIPKPYVIATLTRGANHPNDFGMDAGVERVLHDWTNGNVKDVKGLLCLYQRINGSVIDYKDVSNFYKKQTGAKPFTYFRSIIPMWDNTPRYGGEAFLVHNSRPKFFQNWLEELINYSKKTLPQDRRFILINAWNEWAEGAHLEPDSRYGYAYLNSVGRALSGIPYQNFEYLNNSINPNLKIKIELSETFKINPNFNRELNRKFFICLSKSTLFQKCQVSVEDEIKNQLIFFNPDIPISIVDEKEYNYVFKFNRLCIFFFDSLEIMLKMALTFNNSVILSNSYGDNTEILPVEENFSVDSSFFGSIELRPANVYLNKKICVDARSYVISNNENKYFSETKLPAVTTIVRVHNGENFKMIKNALLCLLGMQGCVVQPLIAAQDLNELQKNELNEIINNYPWDISNKPILKFFESDSKNKDLRSKMLNESLKEVKNRYIAFLDYDDLLFSTAYEWLLKRLYVSNKAIAFGRVYVAQYDNHLQRILLREKTYEYGGTYREFLDINHAPIHSIMLDLSKLDISKIKYYDNQIYLEDYFLTLQLVKENNTDWEGLKQNYYLGDYIHNKDNSQTLAITSLEEKQKIINSKNYIKSEKRICKLKKSIKIRNGSL
jgi:lipopolysaccharide biosynthesis protein